MSSKRCEVTKVDNSTYYSYYALSALFSFDMGIFENYVTPFFAPCKEHQQG